MAQNSRWRWSLKATWYALIYKYLIRNRTRTSFAVKLHVRWNSVACQWVALCSLTLYQTYRIVFKGDLARYDRQASNLWLPPACLPCFDCFYLCSLCLKSGLNRKYIRLVEDSPILGLFWYDRQTVPYHPFHFSWPLTIKGSPPFIFGRAHIVSIVIQHSPLCSCWLTMVVLRVRDYPQSNHFDRPQLPSSLATSCFQTHPVFVVIHGRTFH